MASGDVWNVDPDVVHAKHYHDGYPLCWPMDAEGEFSATSVEKQVTCPDCLGYMKEE